MNLDNFTYPKNMIPQLLHIIRQYACTNNTPVSDEYRARTEILLRNRIRVTFTPNAYISYNYRNIKNKHKMTGFPYSEIKCKGVTTEYNLSRNW